MIQYHFETDFKIAPLSKYSDWLNGIILSANFIAGDLNYIFCADSYLLDINQKYLNHDTYTDIITFDYTDQHRLAGDIFISIDRVKENAMKFEVAFHDELLRVMSHGLLHLMGYGDKSVQESLLMREKENECIKMFHVEQ